MQVFFFNFFFSASWSRHGDHGAVGDGVYCQGDVGCVAAAADAYCVGYAPSLPRLPMFQVQ